MILLTDEQLLLPSTTSAPNPEVSSTRTSQFAQSSLLDSTSEGVQGSFFDFRQPFESVFCLVLLLVFLFVCMGLQMVLYPFYGPYTWMVSHSFQHARDSQLIFLRPFTVAFLRCRIMPSLPMVASRTSFDEKSQPAARLNVGS